MKINFKAALIHHTHSFDAGRESHEYMHPQRDWMLILSFAVLVFFGGVTYSALDFYTQFVMQPEQSFVADKVIRYRDTAIIETAKVYDGDEQMFTMLRADMPPAPAPIETPATTTEAVIKNEEVAPLANDGAPLYTEDASILPL